MLQIFEQRNKVLLTKYPSHFVEDVLRHTEIATTNYNFQKQDLKQKSQAAQQNQRDIEKYQKAKQNEYNSKYAEPDKYKT